MDAERAHGLALCMMKSRFASRFLSGTRGHDTQTDETESRLRVSLWGKVFPNPLGLAAGFDKNAEAITPILSMGFGFTEVGTVTPRAQKGNPRPRIFRDPANHAVINRMGFPNKGLRDFQENLTRFLEQKPRANGLVGLNIGMNKDSEQPARDYAILVRALAPMADYLTVNISSPNTPGLRNFQEPENFKALIGKILDVLHKVCPNHPPPLLVKLAPDLSIAEQEGLARIALEMKLDGLILTNTTLDRPRYLDPEFSLEKGGLSGQPLTSKSNDVIRNFYQMTGGAIPIIGAGGIETADQAYDKIRNGASLVQLYTGLIYQGPSIARDIISGLSQRLERDGLTSIQDAIGAAAK